jgi:hypothetical protein
MVSYLLLRMRSGGNGTDRTRRAGPEPGPNLQNPWIRVSLPPDSSDAMPPEAESLSGPAHGVRQ